MNDPQSIYLARRRTGFTMLKEIENEGKTISDMKNLSFHFIYENGDALATKNQWLNEWLVSRWLKSMKEQNLIEITGENILLTKAGRVSLGYASRYWRIKKDAKEVQDRCAGRNAQS